MRFTVLENSARILEVVTELFKKGTRRRVAVVAYVGEGALDLLPKPDGIEVYCWDQPGGTNPNAIRALIGSGAQVHFAQRLHMKLYWAEGVGAIVGSANLSSNGLKPGGLHELAVRLPAESIRVDALIAKLDAQRVTPAMLTSLEQRTIEYRSRNPSTATSRGRRRLPTFGMWLKDEFRAPFALFPYADDSLELIPASRKELERRGFEDAPDFWTGVAGKTTTGRWILSVDMHPGRNGIYWSMADFRVLVPRSSPEYTAYTTHFAVQLHKMAVYGDPPFNPRELAFKKAMTRFLKLNGVLTSKSADRFPKDGKLTKQHLAQLEQCYRKFGGQV